MIVLLPEEIASTIAVLTKNRERSLNNIIIHRHGEAMNTMSSMGICNDDYSEIVPMYNWEVEGNQGIRDYIKSPMQRVSIDIMTDTEFAFFYTQGRRVTWRKPLHRDSDYLKAKSAKHEASIHKALNDDVIKNSQN